MADQVAAGATVLLAPTWLTHRRALVSVGETRRARDWTSRAASVARQAAEIGGERRGDGPAITILGVLPDPDAIDEGATGRQLRPDAAAERDERAQAGILAETGVDGLLIEARPSLDRARVAVRAAVEHGMETWITLPAVRGDGLALGAWVDTLAADGAGMLLFQTLDGANSEPPFNGPFGVLTPGPLAVPDPREVAATWMERGACLLGIATDATPEALRPLVEERDAAVAAATRTASEDRAELDAWVADATRRAAGGRALWIGDAPRTLPAGFDWTVVPQHVIGALPAGTWRLLISITTLDPRDGARLVERGGIVAGTSDDAGALVAMARAAGLRLDDVTQATAGEWRYIGRREG